MERNRELAIEWYAHRASYGNQRPMTCQTHSRQRYGSILLLILMSLLWRGSVTGQTPDQSLTDLINHADRRPERVWGIMVGTCGSFGIEAEKERTDARSRVKSGASAILDINAVFDLIERRGKDSELGYNPAWLLYAFAKIEGPEAFPRLREMRGDPSFNFLDAAVDGSAALSLGITSYVSGWRQSVGAWCRSPEPRDALDQLILAWEKGDRALLEGALGPHARTALSSLLKERTWDAIRAQFWYAKPSDRLAVGYRLDLQGPWSEPPEPLEDPPGDVEYIGKLDLDVLFKDGSGKDCGSRRIVFLAPGFEFSNDPSFLIDNSNLGDILRLVSFCAANE